MFKSTVRDRANEFRLQEEVFESSRVDTDIAAFDSWPAGDGEVALLLSAVGCRSGVGCNNIVGGDILVRVVDKILLVRHVVERCSEVE